ncbi:Lactoylglutathione lyase [Fusarium oxysporum f. sp. cubense]|uniref:Lactoylglutathione lyase n=1 Tax=Fusarium oxysporum f. sp. cubense TaxID=61366 RepID=A0A559KX06_FUSOC|nr:Lactoylglutathione lyase [Fusarium oxysporum f. sp. cubense]
MSSDMPPPGARTTAERLTANPAGFQLTHSMLRISNPKKSLAFYQDLLCMSRIFTINAGPFTVYYLGYAEDGDQVPADLLSNPSRSGLLELVHITSHDIQSLPESNTQYSNTGFGHLGFKMPDVEAVLNKARDGGWTILKTLDQEPPVAVGIHQSVDYQLMHESFVGMYSRIGFLEDPDG